MIRCVYCRALASYIWWEKQNGYHHPCCLTCYPKATKDSDGDAGSLALDGSRIYKTSQNDGGTEQ